MFNFLTLSVTTIVLIGTSIGLTFTTRLFFKSNTQYIEALESEIIAKSLFSILSIFAFVFTGDGICAFNAIENTLYDPRLIYLILWVLLIPIANLVFLCVKFEERSISKIKKIVLLSSMIFANLLFSILFLIFELTTPGFIIHVGKPLFLIAFSVSLPIEMIGLVLIMVISIIVLTIRLIKLIKKTA